MSPGKALRRALSRAADLLWDLALVVQGVHLETLDQDGVIDGLGERTMLILLDGPDGALGMVELDRETVTGVVEVQTIQQVTNMPADDRPFSATDAAMMAPLIDATMDRFAAYLDGNPLQAQLRDYRFGAMIEDARSAAHLLDAASYRAFRADLDLALGRRKGRISFVFPERKLTSGRTLAPDEPGPHQDKLLRVPARLDCVLARVTIPLARAERLRPGDLLDLPGSVLNDAELRAARGHVVARGRLGQLNGMKAPRILWPRGAQVGAGGATASAAAAAALPEAFDDSFGGTAAPDGGAAGMGMMDTGNEADFAFDADLPMPEPADEPGAAAGAVDFAAEAAAFDLGDFGDDFGAEADQGGDAALTGDDAFAADFGGAGTDGEDGFASAPMDFDFDS